MKWKLITALALAIAIFLTVNIVLIFKGEEDIRRVNYITKWTSVKEQDLLETMPSAGVYIPKEEQHLYYDPNNGSFDGFLVQKGEAVEPGTELFQYSPEDINATRASFQAEIDRLRKEITSIDQHISDMTRIQPNTNTNTTSQTNRATTNNGDSVVVEVHPFDAGPYISQSIARDIEDKKLEKSKLENEIEKYEDLIQSTDTTLMQLTETSELSGTVKDIKHELDNPIITIISNDQKIEGNLNEDEVQQVLPGMKVFITYDNSNKQINGVVDEVFTYPNKKPAVGKENSYRFTVQLEEQMEQTNIYGQHVNLKIITNEVTDALTIPVRGVKKGEENYYSYVLGTGGIVDRRKIEPGLKLNQTQEVKSGLEYSEHVAMERPLFIKANQPFITRLAPTQNTRASYRKLSGGEIAKSITKGFLAR